MLVSGEIAMQNPLPLLRPENPDPNPDVSTADLVKEAIDEARELMKLEVSLARDEVKKEVSGLKTAAVLLGSAAGIALVGLALVLVAAGLFIYPGPVAVLVIGAVLLVAAGVAGLVGYKAVPRTPLADTRRRLETDVKMLKERTA